MDKSSVIHFLRIQEVQLENQLKALRQTMALIEGSNGQVPEHVSATVAKVAQAQPAATQEATAEAPAAVEEKKEAAPPKPKNKLVGKGMVNGRKVRDVKIPKEYTVNLSYTKKLAFLLKEFGPQTSQDLTDRVIKFEPKEDREKVETSVKITASAMFRKGLINAKRKGRAYVYSV